MRASSPFIPALQDTCEEFERSCKTLQSNLSDVAPEHMQNIDIGSVGDNPVPTSGGLAGEVDQNQTSHHVSLSDEDSELVHPDADELER